VTRPNLIVGALAAVCVGMLLWCARLILAADLPRGAHVASWLLWAVATVAVVTLMAYLREFLTHRQLVGREASWKPLPSLVLLWIGGLTALLSFAFILPDKGSSDGAASPAKANTSLTGQTVTSTPAPTTAAPGAARQATSTTSSRSVASRTVPAAPVSTTAPRSTPTGATASRTSTTTATPSTTTSPLIDIHILPPPAHPTTPPGRG
jgi:cytoskeletal protein RodZ